MTRVPLPPPREGESFADRYRRGKVALGAAEPERERRSAFSFLIGGQSQTFYALTEAEARGFAESWARRRGLTVAPEGSDEG